MALASLFSSIKFEKLCNALSPIEDTQIVGYLEFMWHRVYFGRMEVIESINDIEMLAKWKGAPGVFGNALIKTKFIDQLDNGMFTIHDYWGNAPNYLLLEKARAAKDSNSLRSKLSKSSSPTIIENSPTIIENSPTKKRREEKSREELSREEGRNAATHVRTRDHEPASNPAPAIAAAASTPPFFHERDSEPTRRDSANEPEPSPEYPTDNPVAPTSAPRRPDIDTGQQRSGPLSDYSIPCRGGTLYTIPAATIARYKTEYPQLNVPDVIAKLQKWCFVNPQKLRSLHGTPQFIDDWFTHEFEPQTKKENFNAPVIADLKGNFDINGSVANALFPKPHHRPATIANTQ